MIYKQVSFADFSAEFEKYGRKDQFSPSALELIFNYLDNDDVDQRLDVIAICCDFSEETLEDVETRYDIPIDEAREYLDNSTTVLGETDAGTIVYLNF